MTRKDFEDEEWPRTSPKKPGESQYAFYDSAEGSGETRMFALNVGLPDVQRHSVSLI
jgi:hypothetical protein